MTISKQKVVIMISIMVMLGISFVGVTATQHLVCTTQADALTPSTDAEISTTPLLSNKTELDPKVNDKTKGGAVDYQPPETFLGEDFKVEMNPDEYYPEIEDFWNEPMRYDAGDQWYLLDPYDSYYSNSLYQFHWKDLDNDDVGDLHYYFSCPVTSDGNGLLSYDIYWINRDDAGNTLQRDWVSTLNPPENDGYIHFRWTAIRESSTYYYFWLYYYNPTSHVWNTIQTQYDYVQNGLDWVTFRLDDLYYTPNDVTQYKRISCYYDLSGSGALSASLILDNPYHSPTDFDIFYGNHWKYQSNTGGYSTSVVSGGIGIENVIADQTIVYFTHNYTRINEPVRDISPNAITPDCEDLNGWANRSNIDTWIVSDIRKVMGSYSMKIVDSNADDDIVSCRVQGDEQRTGGVTWEQEKQERVNISLFYWLESYTSGTLTIDFYNGTGWENLGVMSDVSTQRWHYFKLNGFNATHSRGSEPLYHNFRFNLVGFQGELYIDSVKFYVDNLQAFTYDWDTEYYTLTLRKVDGYHDPQLGIDTEVEFYFKVADSGSHIEQLFDRPMINGVLEIYNERNPNIYNVLGIMIEVSDLWQEQFNFIVYFNVAQLLHKWQGDITYTEDYITYDNWYDSAIYSIWIDNSLAIIQAEGAISIPRPQSSGNHTISVQAWFDLNGWDKFYTEYYVPMFFFNRSNWLNETFTNEIDYYVSVESFYVSDFYTNLFVTASMSGSYTVYENDSAIGSGSYDKEGTLISSTRSEEIGLIRISYKFDNSSQVRWFNTTYANAEPTTPTYTAYFALVDQFGIGLGFETAIITVNDSRVFFPLQQYASTTLLEVKAYDFFDAILFTESYTVNADLQINITVNLWEIIFRNTRNYPAYLKVFDEDGYEARDLGFERTIPANSSIPVRMLSGKYNYEVWADGNYTTQEPIRREPLTDRKLLVQSNFKVSKYLPATVNVFKPETTTTLNLGPYMPLIGSLIGGFVGGFAFMLLRNLVIEPTAGRHIGSSRYKEHSDLEYDYLDRYGPTFLSKKKQEAARRERTRRRQARGGRRG